MSTAELEREDLEVYHDGSDGHHTSTAIRTLIIEGPVVYRETFITRRMPKPKKKEFMVGTASHTLLLEPEKFEATVKLIPTDKLASNGARSGNKYKDFCAEHAGCILLKPDEFDAIRWMADEVFREAREVIEAAGVIETTIKWTDEASGLLCKCRPDKLCQRVIVDIKTGADVTPEGFAKSCGAFRYDVQGTHYRSGVEQEHGVTADVLFVAIEKTPPYRVKIYELSPADMDTGWRDCQDALAEIKRRTDENDWREAAVGAVIPITIPPYARKRA